MFFVQLAVVLVCILVGARIGGVGLGIMGGVGLSVLTFVFGLQPTAPPIDVMLMIVAVVSAAACMQAAGGLDYLVGIAERILRRNPKYITFMGPAVTYIFTMFSGTGHVAYSVLPVIAEVARRTGVRPERPLSISVIASQVAIVACPISAATVALLGILSPQGIELMDILLVTIPATVFGVFLAAVITNKLGKELKDDPEYHRRMKDPDFRKAMEDGKYASISGDVKPGAKISVLLFLLGSISVVILGAIPSLRPVFESSHGVERLGMAHAIEIIMLTVAALIVLLGKVNIADVTKGGVFIAGMQAVIAIFGIAWLGDTFFGAHDVLLKASINDMVHMAPWSFAIALFVMSIMVNSQAATTRTLMPLGLLLGLSPVALIAMFPAVNGYFFVPNYGPIIAAIGFDTTGTTRIGKFVFNHSFMLPGLMSLCFSVLAGFLIAPLIIG